MKKYWQIYKINIVRALSYRAALIIYRLSNFLILLVMATVWLAATHSGLIGGFTTGELLTYYIAGMVLTPLVMWTVDHKVSEEINSGTIVVNFISKPISYYWSKYFAELGWHTISPLFALISLFLSVLLFGNQLHLEFLIINLPFLILSVILAASLFFVITYLIGLLSFWFTDIEGFSEIFWMFVFLFSGQGIPLTFYPTSIKNFFYLSPFRFIFSFPLEILTNKLENSQIILGLSATMIWILGLSYIAKKVLNRGLKNYSAFGN